MIAVGPHFLEAQIAFATFARVLADRLPHATPEVAPDVTPEVTPEVTPDVTPEVTPEATPEVAPEVTQHETPHVAPHQTPHVSAEVARASTLGLAGGGSRPVDRVGRHPGSRLPLRTPKVSVVSEVSAEPLGEPAFDSATRWFPVVSRCSLALGATRREVPATRSRSWSQTSEAIPWSCGVASSEPTASKGRIVTVCDDG